MADFIVVNKTVIAYEIDLITSSGNGDIAAGIDVETDIGPPLNSVADIQANEVLKNLINAGNVVLKQNGVELSQLESLAAQAPATGGPQGTIATDNSTAPIQTVFGRTGDVTAQPGDYSASDVGADPVGTGASEASSAVSTHEGAANPHTVYQLGAEKGVANGYAELDGTGKVPLSQIPDLNGLSFQGLWDANANSPTLTSSVGTEGYFYIVSTAGTTTLDGINDWQVKDWAVFTGGVWNKLDNTDSVVSVNGQTGVVVLTLGDVSGIITDGQHGDRGGGTLHAAATTSVNGFMSSSDKTKLDSIESGAKDDQDADEVPVTTVAPYIDGDVQQSLEDIQTAIQNIALGEIPAAIARRTTTLAVTGTYTDITFNQTSVETDTSVIEHDNSLTDRILLKEPGAYIVFFSTMISCGGEDNVNFRVRLNDATTISDFPDSFFVDAGSSSDFDWNLTRIGAVVTTQASDFISLQVSETGGNSNLTNVLFGAIRLRAPKGDDGPAGSGAVNLEQDGSPVSGGPFSVLNFAGATVTDGGSGQGDITIPTDSYAQTQLTSPSAASFTGPTTVAFTAKNDPEGIGTLSGGEFTVNFTGFLEVGYSVSASAVWRERLDAWVELNTVEVPGTREYSYIRNTNDYSSATLIPWRIAVTSGDVIRFRVDNIAGGGTLTLITAQAKATLKRTI